MRHVAALALALGLLASPAVAQNTPYIPSSVSVSPANPTATAGPTAVNGSATTYMRSDGAPAVQKASAAQFGLAECDNSTITCPGGVFTGATQSTGANPTATAGPTAVNGAASTFMRSDGAPAVQKASAAQFGLAECDNSTITCPGGVFAGATTGGANPSATAGATAINGSATTYMRSDAAPAVQAATSSLAGILTLTTAAGLHGQQLITSTTTFTTGANITTLYLTGCAGGGQGGGSAATSGGVASGGSGGQCTYHQAVTVTASTGYTATVGAGGSTGTSATNGQAGGTSSFDSLVSLTGGNGGNYAAAAVSGGVAGVGAFSQGGDIGYASSVFNTIQCGGNGGDSLLGQGGRGACTTGSSGTSFTGGAGTGYGAGGQGGMGAAGGAGGAGGAGSRGVWLVQW